MLERTAHAWRLLGLLSWGCVPDDPRVAKLPGVATAPPGVTPVARMASEALTLDDSGTDAVLSALGAAGAGDGGADSRDPAAPASQGACDESRWPMLFDTRGKPDEREWIRVQDAGHTWLDPRHVVLQSRQARVTYQFLNAEQQGAHSLYVPAAEGWRRITSPVYGDYTYWGSSIILPASRAEVVRLEPRHVAVRFVFDHTFDYPGLAAQSVRLEKTVAMVDCHPGMFELVHGEPANIEGEREVGLGLGVPAAYTSHSFALHPAAGQHVNLELERTLPPHWVAGLSDENETLATLVLNRPIEVNSYQFAADQLGRVTIHFLDQQSRVPEQYQLFIGGRTLPRSTWFGRFAPNVSSFDDDRCEDVCAWVQAGDLGTLSLGVPVAGRYSLWLRGRSDGGATIEARVGGYFSSGRLDSSGEWQNVLLGHQLDLDAGEQSLEWSIASGGAELDAAMLVPLTGAPGFPLDLAVGAGPVLRGAE